MPNSLFLLLVLQGPFQLTAREVSAGVATVIARQVFSGVEIAPAYRPGTDTRIALALAAGTTAREAGATARAQATVQMLLNSTARSGVGWYAGLGAALRVRRRDPGQAFLALLLGVEAAPGNRRAWYVEVGFAGGVRAAAGWRLRSFPSWWRF